MKKIPVGATIAHAYRFAFGQFFVVLGLTWLPIVVLYVGPLLLIFTQFKAAASANYFNSLILVLDFTSFIAMTLQMAGVCKQALGLRTGPAYAYLVVDATVCRLFASYLAVFFALFGGMILVVIAAIAGFTTVNTMTNATSMAVKAGGAILGILLLVATPAAFCALIYSIMRTSFLLAPVCVNEGGFGLARSWRLGRRNFWRMFAILLCLLVPLFLVVGIFEFSIIYGPMMDALKSISKAGAVQGQAQAQLMQTTLLRGIASKWYLLVPLLLAFTALYFGLLGGAVGSAYRTLTEDSAQGAA